MLKPTTDARELLRRIERFCNDTSEWTIEELKEDLRERGIDPDEMLRRIKDRTKHLINWKEKNDGMDDR